MPFIRMDETEARAENARWRIWLSDGRRYFVRPPLVREDATGRVIGVILPSEDFFVSVGPGEPPPGHTIFDGVCVAEDSRPDDRAYHFDGSVPVWIALLSPALVEVPLDAFGSDLRREALAALEETD